MKRLLRKINRLKQRIDNLEWREQELQYKRLALERILEELQYEI